MPTFRLPILRTFLSVSFLAPGAVLGSAGPLADAERWPEVDDEVEHSRLFR